jgi:hypothetical protein
VLSAWLPDAKDVVACGPNTTAAASSAGWNYRARLALICHNRITNPRRIVMGFGRGALLWLLGIPLPLILLLALFMHH